MSKMFSANFKLNSGTEESAVGGIEKSLHIQLPESYRKFLLRYNGGEGFLGADTYLCLWSVDEIARHYRGYGFSEYLPHCIPIGSDGGGEALVIRAKGNSLDFGLVPFGDLKEDSFVPISRDFDDTVRIIGEGGSFDVNSAG